MSAIESEINDLCTRIREERPEYSLAYASWVLGNDEREFAEEPILGGLLHHNLTISRQLRLIELRDELRAVVGDVR